MNPKPMQAPSSTLLQSALGRLVILVVLPATLLAALLPLPVAAAPNELETLTAAYERGEHETARAGFERLSRAGVPAADYNLAVMHLRSELPGASVDEARRLMLRAADGGFVTAMFGLGQLFENGNGVKRNLVTSHQWYLKAAEAGSVDAQVAVATAHYLGRGAAKDPALASRWYREAAKGGDVGAQYLLASMYEQGDGVDRDLRLARYWYDIAARNGDVAAPAKVKEIDLKMSLQPG